MNLIEQMAVSKWRQQRMWTAESASFDLTMDRQEKEVAKEFKAIDGPTRLCLAFHSAADRGSLALFHRYETALRRSWERAFDRLQSMQAKSQKFQNEPNPKNEHTE